MPRVSIIVPTRNRPRQLRQAVRSVLAQTDADYELIVSDNSTDSESARQNAELCSELLTPPNTRLVRPARSLSMPDHWEWATRHAAGEFVLVLTDRLVLRPSALALIRELSSAPTAPELITWDGYCGMLPWGVLPPRYWSGRIEVRSSSDAVRRFAQMGNYRAAPLWQNSLPRTMSNCFHSSLAERIRNRHGRMFFPMSPDYTSAFHLLSVSESHVYVDRPLAVAHGWASNGAECLMRDRAFRHFMASVGQDNWIEQSPLRIETVTNSLAVDLLSCVQREPDRFPQAEIDIAGLWLTNLRELVALEEIGSLKDVVRLRDVLFTLLSAVPQEQRDFVAQEAALMKRYGPMSRRWRRLKGWLSLKPSAQRCYATLQYLVARSRGAVLYRDAVHAAEATDAVVWNRD